MIHRELKELREENQRLRQDAAAVIFEEMHFTPEDGFDVRMRSKIGIALTMFIRECIKAGGGQNFITTTLTFGGDDPVYMTFGRVQGMSVEFMYHEVCAERDELKRKINQFREAKP